MYRLDWTQINKENTNPKCGKLPTSSHTPSSHQLIDVSVNHAVGAGGLFKEGIIQKRLVI
jgi:hypothetical protein